MKKLLPEQYRILKERGTEPAFSGKLLHTTKKGRYRCAGCGTLLFSSRDKFESGTGWPSFCNATNVELREDTSYGMHRTEVTCKHCKGHLGHLFNDGPGTRYCINSLALEFSEHP